MCNEQEERGVVDYLIFVTELEFMLLLYCTNPYEYVFVGAFMCFLRVVCLLLTVLCGRKVSKGVKNDN